MSLTPDHAAFLESSAIPVDMAIAAGVYSVTSADQMPDGLRWGGTGIIFPWHPLHGDPVPQYRPDDPKPGADGTVRKYLFPKGNVPMNIPPTMRERVGTASTVFIAEGTKQGLAAVAHAPPDCLVVGMAGCWGFSHGGAADPDLDQLVAGRPVVIALDADVDTNPNVYDAGARLAEHLQVVGATSVAFVKLPAGGTVGLDDFLAQRADPAAALARLIGDAGKLGRRPKQSSPDGAGRFFDANGLRVVDLVAAVRAGGHHAVGPEGGIWGYKAGVYTDSDPVVGAVGALLGNRYRPLHRKAVEELLADELCREGHVLGDTEVSGLVNVRNGMLRIATGALEPHDPAHLSRTQLAIDWDPTATCPEFDTWLTDRCGDQADDLLEAAGLMLCPWIGQRRVVFLFGPARSGKSTFLRLLEALAGRHRVAVTMHALASNRFAAASLFGALLNVAGDLSDHHVDDLSIFKQLTGDDPVPGERKFRDPFTFRNRALFVFSANTPPTVSETSRAYLARIRPFLFPTSVEGHEDPATDDRLAQELPGVLVRLVEGAQRWLQRGGYGPGNPMVADEFAQQSDVAAMFASQVLTADPAAFTSGREMFDAYRDWADANGRGRLGRNKFLARLENTLGQRERAAGHNTGPTGWRDVRVLHADEWVDPGTLARFAFFSPTSPHEETGGGSGEVGPFPREGEVGPNRANRARPEPDPFAGPRVREPL